jgi:hypothetical protein
MHAPLNLGGALLVVLLAAFGCGASHEDGANPQPSAVGDRISVDGELVCLPHTAGAPQTFECAIGLRESDKRHYGLKNAKQEDLGLNQRVRVTGRFTPGRMEPYEVVGTIDVESLVTIDGGS